MDYEKFKTAVLRSGIPLEKTISQALYPLDICDIGEYFYERDNKLFSIDSISTTHFQLRFHTETDPDDVKFFQFNINFLIECKYKEPNHRWVFASYQHPKDLIPGRIMFDTIFLDTLLQHKLNRNGYVLNEDNPGYCNITHQIAYGEILDSGIPLVNTGAEIIENDKKPNGAIIREALSQISYGVASHTVDEIKNYLEMDCDLIDLGVLIYPVIVTTADLFLIKKYQNIDKIKASKKVEESFEKVSAVMYCVAPNSQISDYFASRMRSNKVELLRSSSLTEKSIDRYIERFRWLHPPILILNFSSFKKNMKRIKERYGKLFTSIFDNHISKLK